MLTAGQLLKQVRATKGLSLDLIAAQTNIKKEYLKAIEADEYDKLPSEISANGFVGVYAEFLGIDKTRALALKRRAQQSVQEANEKSLTTSSDKLGQRQIKGWQKIAGFIAIVSLVIAIVFYIAFQISSFQKPPTLELIKPAKDTTVQTNVITLEGLTDKDSILTLNDSPIEVRGSGFFSIEYTLSPGQNVLVLKARKKSNQTKVSQVIRKIRYDAPEETEPEDLPAQTTENTNTTNTDDGLAANKIQISATDTVWVAVNIDGTDVLVQTLNAGDKKDFEIQDEITINTALPQALQIKWGDTELKLQNGITTCNRHEEEVICR